MRCPGVGSRGRARCCLTFVIGLREGLEATLIVVIIAIVPRQGGPPRDSLRPMWAGVGVAVLFCLGSSAWRCRCSIANLPQVQQEQLETVIALAAAAAVTYMVVWMRRHAGAVCAAISRLPFTGALARGSGRALVGMAFFAVIREGLETAVFLMAAFQQSARPALTGQRRDPRHPRRGRARPRHLPGRRAASTSSRFFRVTGVVLVVVAGGLARLGAPLGPRGRLGERAPVAGRRSELARRARVGPRVAADRRCSACSPTLTTGEALAWAVYVVPMIAATCSGPRAGVVAPAAGALEGSTA